MTGLMGLYLRNMWKGIRGKKQAHEFPDLLERNRGSLDIRMEGCNYCGRCRQVCLPEAIEPDPAGRYIRLDTYACILCGRCVEACPYACIQMMPEHWTATRRRQADIIRRNGIG